MKALQWAAVLVMVLAAVLALTVNLLVGTAVFFIGWGVWFASQIR